MILPHDGGLFSLACWYFSWCLFNFLSNLVYKIIFSENVCNIFLTLKNADKWRNWIIFISYLMTLLSLSHPLSSSLDAFWYGTEWPASFSSWLLTSFFQHAFYSKQKMDRQYPVHRWKQKKTYTDLFTTSATKRITVKCAYIF